MLKKIGAIALLIAGLSQAEIYKWTDAKGVTHYSQERPEETKSTAKVDIQTEYSAPEQQPYIAPRTPTPATENYTRKVENQNTYAEWNQCAETKRRAIIAEKRRARNAEELNEWLWQNCRGYSNELREIERSMM